VSFAQGITRASVNVTSITPPRDRADEDAFGPPLSIAAASRVGVLVQDNDNVFFPRGAVAFFAALVAFYALFWAAMMALMVSRG